ncbi:MAG TPA: hypothetical protein VNG90_03685 [Candidatus Acidoferrum sp.]|nr:hypothetical protein [Candidatus Acidoferrum sp.]
MTHLKPGQYPALSDEKTEVSLKNDRIVCWVYLGSAIAAVCFFVCIAWLCFFGEPLDDALLARVFIIVGIFSCASCVVMAAVGVNMVIELRTIAAKLRDFR